MALWILMHELWKRVKNQLIITLCIYIWQLFPFVELIHSVESKSSGFISLLISLVLASFEFFTSSSLQKAQSYWMNQSRTTFSEQHSREEDSQGWWPSEQSWQGGTCRACQTCCATALTIRSQPGGGQGVYILSWKHCWSSQILFLTNKLTQKKWLAVDVEFSFSPLVQSPRWWSTWWRWR